MGLNRIFSFLISFIFISSIISSSAYAINGIKIVGVTARDTALGGASSASAKDSSVIVKNPAALSKLSNSYDIGFLVAFPDAKFKSTGMLGNSSANDNSAVNLIGAFSFGAKVNEFDYNGTPISLGLGLYSIAGLESKFKSSRTNPYLLGENFDRKITLRHTRLPLAISTKINDELSVGLALNLGISAFRADMTTSGFTRTTGNNHWDFATGCGYTLGFLYDFTDNLSFAISYESETWMNEFDDYKDILPKLDIPPTFHFGISYNATDKLELNFEYSLVEYSRVTYFDRIPSKGGFGWRDQNVYALGIEYLLNDSFTLRAGYNYSKSPIRGDVMFANGLAPLVTEHHLAFGTAINIGDDKYLDITYEHSFKNSVTDDGSGDVYSTGGKGSKGTLSIDSIWVGLTQKF